MVRAIQFLAIFFTALALVPGGAHVLALPNKIGLAQDPYFVAQSIYRGWALLGVVVFAALASNLAVAGALRRQALPSRLALAAAAAIIATLVVFFIWTYPANVATDNWQSVPADWQQLRAQWEYSHAVNAAITAIGLACIVWSVLLYRPPVAR